MATYYIDPVNGVTENAGTDQFAPTTWDKFLNTGRVQLSGSNTYLQKRGTSQNIGDGDATYKTFILISSGGASSAAPLIIGAYGTGELPILTGSKTSIGCAIRATGTSSNIVIQDLEIRDHGAYNASGRQRAIDMDSNTGKSNITVQRCKFYNIAENAVLIYADNVYVYDNYFEKIGEDAIQINTATTEVVCTGNWIKDVSMQLTTGDGIQVNGDVATVNVSNNYIDHRSQDYKQCIIHDHAATATGTVTIANNECWGPSSSATHQVIACKGSGRIYGNKIYSGHKGIYTSGQSPQIYGNLIVLSGDEAGFGICPDVGANAEVFNNTVVRTSSNKSNTTEGILQGTSGGTGGNVRNNIVVGFVNGIRKKTGGLTESYNNIVDCTRKVADASAPTVDVGMDATSKTVAPLFDPRYKPTNAQLYNGGATVSGSDLYGNTLPASPSFGAIQCIGTFPRGMLTDYESVGDKESFIRGRGRRR